MQPWSSTQLPGRDGDTVIVTVVPARHGPDGTDRIMGPVVGFVLDSPGSETVYVSGDNASLAVVHAIARAVRQRRRRSALRGSRPGSAPVRRGAYLTLSSDFAAEAAKILGAKVVFL